MRKTLIKCTLAKLADIKPAPAPKKPKRMVKERMAFDFEERGVEEELEEREDLD